MPLRPQCEPTSDHHQYNTGPQRSTQPPGVHSNRAPLVVKKQMDSLSAQLSNQILSMATCWACLTCNSDSHGRDRRGTKVSATFTWGGSMSRDYMKQGGRSEWTQVKHIRAGQVITVKTQAPPSPLPRPLQWNEEWLELLPYIKRISGWISFDDWSCLSGRRACLARLLL